MKSTFLLTLFLFFAFLASAQTIDDFEDLRVLENEAFNMLIVEDITYAISGEATPTSGIKIDITKPEGTISGSFKPKKEWVPWSLFTFELKGGVTDRSFNILKGFGNANSAYEFRPSFHFILPKNSSKYGVNPEATRKKLLVSAKNQLAKSYKKGIEDSLLVMSHIRERHLAPILTLSNSAGAVAPSLLAPIPNDAEHVKIALYFIKRILKTDNPGVDTSSSLNDILNKMSTVIIDMTAPQEDAIKGYRDEVSILYKKYADLNKNSETIRLRKMILNASDIWTQKTYTWWTVSPFIRTEKITEYFDKYEQKDSSYFKSDYHFFYGISGYLNRYIVRPHKIAHLIRVGATISLSNNLTTLASYNYETRDPHFSDSKSTTEKTKTGTAFNNSDILEGTLKQVSAEYYLLPLKSLIPGVYFSTNVNQGKIYNLVNVKNRQDDKWQVSLEGGLIFNITSRDKDKEKSILSLLAYIRHEDLSDSRRTNSKTNIIETTSELRKRNITIGLRVGIPITLPQREE